MSEFDLNSYMEAQSSEGALDSQGEFSVDATKAARKLAQFALPGEFSWVLKVVQAAVAWKTCEIQVKQTRTTTSFLFPLASESVPTPQLVVKTILTGRLDQQKPLEMLCMALRALVEQGGLSFVLGLRREKAELETLYAGADMSALDGQSREEFGQISATGIRLTVSHQLAGEYYLGRYLPKMMRTKRRDLAIVSMLIENCWVCPVPLKLDGRHLNGYLEHPNLGFTGSLRPLFAIGLNALEDVPEMKIFGPMMTRNFPVFESQAQAIQLSENERAQSWCLWQMHQPILKAQYTLDVRVERSSFLHWVRDGVIVESQSLEFSSSRNQVALVVNAEGLEGDLTGLRLSDNWEKQKRVNQVLKASKEELGKRRANLGSLVSFECQLTEEELEQEKRDQRNSDLLKAALTLPFFKLGPLLPVGALAGGAILRAVQAKFPERGDRAEVEQWYLDSLRDDLEDFMDTKLRR